MLTFGLSQRKVNLFSRSTATLRLLSPVTVAIIPGLNDSKD